MAHTFVAPLLVIIALVGVSGQFLHHSRSPYGPWEPVIPADCNESVGVWPKGGGNNPSPVIVDEEISKMTGLPANSIVIITTFSNSSRAHPNPNPALRAFMAVGIANSWREPVIINPQPLWFLPDQNNYENHSVVADPWEGFMSEDPCFYFDKHRKRWRALFHEVRRPGSMDPKGALVPEGPVDRWCGGYAESMTTDLWGPWKAYSPQDGAYSKDIDFDPHGVAHASLRNKRRELQSLSSTVQAPFVFGKSYPAYMNESLTTWGGNVILGDDNLYHLFAAAFSSGINNHSGACGVGTWMTNSLVIHAIATSPVGPFKMNDVALPNQHHNPHITRATDGEYLLYSIGGYNCSHSGQSDCGLCGYGSCKACHKGHCGPQPCPRPSPFAPLGPGKLTLRRRERPKLLLDKSGIPTHLYNAADPGPAQGSSHPNPGWEDRPFTMVTEILATDSSLAYV